MSTAPFFNPSPAAQGQLLEALASDQSSINHLAEFFNTTAEAISLFITTDSFATRFAAIGSTNASLIRFSAGLNLHSAVRLLNTLALKLDEQLRTIPVDYTNPIAIEQFRRRAECARQVASALYRLSRFTHEPPRARASNFDSNSDATANQTRTSAPAAHQTPNHERIPSLADWHDQPLPAPLPTSNEPRGSGTSEHIDPATQSPLPNLNQTRASEPTERSDPAAQMPPAIVSSGLPETRASESAEQSDPGTYVPALRDHQPTATTNPAPAHEPAHEPAPPSDPSSSSSATSRASSVTSVFLPSSPASLPASTPAAPRSDPSPSATSRAASETSAFPPSFPALPDSLPSGPLDDEALELLANQLLAFTNMLESKLPQPVS